MAPCAHLLLVVVVVVVVVGRLVVQVLFVQNLFSLVRNACILRCNAVTFARVCLVEEKFLKRDTVGERTDHTHIREVSKLLRYRNVLVLIRVLFSLHADTMVLGHRFFGTNPANVTH